MNKRRIFVAIGAVVCAAAVTMLIIFYSFFTSSHIFSESANHLQEIYGQVNAQFSSVVTRNWNVLKGWSKYIEETAANDENALSEFIEARREDWEFTNFYFLNEQGTGRLVKAVKNDEGEDIYERELNISEERLRDLKDGKNVVVTGMRGDDNVEIVLFAIPIDKGVQHKYKDFDYNALGITFDSSDMTKTLNIEAFSGEGRCYITDSAGDVIIDSESGKEDGDYFTNFVEHLKEHKATFINGSLEEVEEGIRDDKTSVVLFHIHNTEYYLSFHPVKSDDGKQFNDWMMLGIVPSNVLNASMSSFRTITVVIMAGIFVLVAAAIIVVIIFINRRHIQAKELELKSRDGLFDLLTITTNEIFVLFSPENFNCQYISPNIERVLGINPDDIRRDVRNIMQAAISDFNMLTTEEVKKYVNDNSWSMDVQMRNNITGYEYWFKVTLYKADNVDSDSVVIMFSDRTKERRMNENLQQALDIAKAANSAKSNFLSNMSHDIRTPMNAIIGFATLLAKDADKPDKVLEYIHKITFSSQHLLGLINDVLDMSKIESGKTSLNMEEFSFSEFLEELYTIMLPQTKAKKQSLEIHTKGLLPEKVLGDKLRLNQIMMNLLSNAVKYTPAEGHININVEALANTGHNRVKLKLVVADDGIGMSEQFVKMIFEPFTRESTKATREIQGTGLGMAITKNIVDLMGGMITVDSKLGEGSTFTVEIELATVDDSEAQEEFWVNHCITRALVVDDEEDVCTNIQKLMEDTGVEISYALDGHTAVDMVYEACDKHEDFNIVLLDWKMPGLNGIEVAKLIRKKIGNEVPILVLTSYDFEEIEEDAKEAGIDFFLPKPFFVSNFRRAVAQLTDDQKIDNNEIKSNEDDTSLKGLKFLAAEDNDINVEILVELLKMEGAECDVASDGKQVLDMFVNCKPGSYDYILMDIQMPVMNGYEATRAIRASGHPEAMTIPILAMTANAFADDVKAAFDSGMNAHLAKPIDIGMLKKTIKELRDGKQ